jgi:hypothetical protein
MQTHIKMAIFIKLYAKAYKKENVSITQTLKN